jgi:inner membrane protein
MATLSPWWLWLLGGCILFVVELVTPGGFFLFFFGAGALVVALLTALGLAGPAWLQWFLFGVISTTTIFFLRKPLQRRIGSSSNRPIDTMVGETAIALSDIPVHHVDKVELRGSAWNARNIGATYILKGQRCHVERVEGLTLCVRNGA